MSIYSQFPPFPMFVVTLGRMLRSRGEFDPAVVGNPTEITD